MIGFTNNDPISSSSPISRMISASFNCVSSFSSFHFKCKEILLGRCCFSPTSGYSVTWIFWRVLPTSNLCWEETSRASTNISIRSIISWSVMSEYWKSNVFNVVYELFWLILKIVINDSVIVIFLTEDWKLLVTGRLTGLRIIVDVRL